MEVMIQSPSTSPTKDTFNFNISGTMTSPYLSAPSSPKRFGEYYLSAPTSPSRISQLYSEFEYFADSTIQEPINNNNNNVDNDNDSDDVDVDEGFAFSVGRELDNNKYSSRSAEELFHGGKIKPLKPEIESNEQKQLKQHKPRTESRRGREREVLSSVNSGRRVTRSLSPYRKANNTWELEEQNLKEQQQQQPRSNKEETTLTSTTTKSSSSRRWSLNLNLKDLLLFRSASEGRGSSKDPLKTFVGYKKGSSEDVKGSSFRSSSDLRKKAPVSAHEFHYAMKKAESQDMKKRTFLPYRQGILGRLSGFGL